MFGGLYPKKSPSNQADDTTPERETPSSPGQSSIPSATSSLSTPVPDRTSEVIDKINDATLQHSNFFKRQKKRLKKIWRTPPPDSGLTTPIPPSPAKGTVTSTVRSTSHTLMRQQSLSGAEPQDISQIASFNHQPSAEILQSRRRILAASLSIAPPAPPAVVSLTLKELQLEDEADEREQQLMLLAEDFWPSPISTAVLPDPIPAPTYPSSSASASTGRSSPPLSPRSEAPVSPRGLVSDTWTLIDDVYANPFANDSSDSSDLNFSADGSAHASCIQSPLPDGLRTRSRGRPRSSSSSQKKPSSNPSKSRTSSHPDPPFVNPTSAPTSSTASVKETTTNDEANPSATALASVSDRRFLAPSPRASRRSKSSSRSPPRLRSPASRRAAMSATADSALSESADRSPLLSSSRKRTKNLAQVSAGPAGLSLVEAFVPQQPPSAAPLASEAPSPTADPNWDLGDWNQRFQTLITRYRRSTVADYARVAINEELLHLAEDFINTAKSYGRIIILERYLKVRSQVPNPHAKQFFKTIEPIDVGGRAGGEKFVLSGILFKFAVDTHGLYGNDSFAAKVASLELQGLMAYFNLGLPEIHVPLMALVDFMGFRLIAISLLPIQRSTIIYGSADGGRSVARSNPTFNLAMRRAAKCLNIKPHFCGLISGQERYLSSAADIEGHQGSDGRCYLLDFARTFPPVQPDPNYPQGHLYRLFRPELLASFKKPLCPDAFSGFILQDPDMKVHNTEIREATQYLHDHVIPAAVKDLKWSIHEAVNSDRFSSLRIPEMLHRSGVNMRYLGRCFRATDDLMTKAVLLVEIAARIIRNDLRRRIRDKMAELHLPLEAPYRVLTVDFLNMVFYNALQRHPTSCQYWNETLPADAQHRFDLPSWVIETAPEAEAENWQLKSGRLRADSASLAFLRSSKQYGLPASIPSLLISRLFLLAFSKPAGTGEVFEAQTPFTVLHLGTLDPSVKHMNIIDNATGNFFYHMASTVSSAQQATEIYLEAARYYERALSSNPNDWETLLNSAECWYKVLVFQVSGGKSISSVTLDPSHHLVTFIESFYFRALKSSKENPFVRYKYARFLTRCGPTRFHKAESQYLRSLDLDPNNVECLMSYATFLRSDMEQLKAADEFDQRCSQLRRMQLENDNSPKIAISATRAEGVNLRSTQFTVTHRDRSASLSNPSPSIPI